MPETKELAAKIEKTWEQIKSKQDEILESVKAISGRVNQLEAGGSEHIQEMEKRFAELDALKSSLDDLETREAREVVKPVEQSERETAYKSAFYKWVRGGVNEMASDEVKTLNEALSPERKALVEDTAGLYLVPEDLESEIIRALPQLNPLRNYCRIRPTGRDKVRIRSLTELSVGWGKLELGTAPTESDQTPSQEYIYVEDLNGLAKIGKDELEDTEQNLAAILGDSFSMALANEEAKRFAIGRGHTTYEEPAGMAVDATLIASSTYKNNWTTDDTAATEDMLTCEYNLPEQYLQGSIWIMRRKTELALRLLRAEVANGYYGNYLWQPSLMTGQPNNFDGYPVINQNDMNYPADATAGINALFGNPKNSYMILERKGMTIQRLNELYAESGLVGFLVHRRVGGGVYRDGAMTGIYNNT